MVDSKRCFMIGPIGAVGSPERKRSDQVLKHIFAPAAQACGYDVPVRADHISDPGTITLGDIVSACWRTPSFWPI